MNGKKKKYKCNICSYRTAYTKDLIVHIRKHTGEKPFECSVCGKPFSQLNNCKRHEARHTGEKPYECDVCHTRFTEKGSLMKHMRFHTGDETFKCTICNKVFSQSGHLKEHMPSHSDDKPYKCLHCDKSFKRKEGYTLHMLSCHNPEEHTYKCSTCGKVFSLPRYLKKHIRLRHGEKPYECSVCNKRFAAHYVLLEHSKSHTKQKKKKLSESLGKKKLTENEKHTSRKIFQCKCLKNFSSESNVKRHMKHKHPENDYSFVELPSNSSCDTQCPTQVSIKNCEPIGHTLREPLELNSYVKVNVKSVDINGDDNDNFTLTNVEKHCVYPKLCPKQEICSGDEISNEFEDYKIKEEDSFALEEQSCDQDVELDESSLVIRDNEFHTVYIKEELHDSSS